MKHTPGAPRTAAVSWWKRENLLPGSVLLVVAAVAWAYTLAQAGAMNGIALPTTTGSMGDLEMLTDGMDTAGTAENAGAMVQPGGLLLFLFGWAAMMIAMMLPAALPLILLYRTIARQRLQPTEAVTGMVALLVGYVGVWTVAGLPVYAYNRFSGSAGRIMTVLPGFLLIVGGVYQFTALKQGCHTRCSNPLFFLMNKWRAGIAGAVRLGVLHGADCLGCCVGLMVALVALGMMHVAWMLTAAVIIFVEKTHPSGHRVARPLGIALVLGGGALLGASLLSGRGVM
jgi:predicted metal-binding membrane protein